MADVRGDGLTDLYERFLAFEKTSGVAGRTVAGVRAWALVRVGVFSLYVLPKSLPVGPAHPDFGVKKGGGGPLRLGGRVKRFLARLYARLRFSPRHAVRPRDILFSLMPRMMRLPDGRAVAQMLDFFIPDLACSSAVLEARKPGDAYPPHPNGRRVFRLDGYVGRLSSFMRTRQDVADEAAAFAAQTASELSAAFGVEVDVAKFAGLVRRAVCAELFYGPQFRAWLRRLRVKCVVTVVHYSRINQILCAAAHAEGIPVVELQHGTIYSAHPAYNLPHRDARYAPDYLFAWGRHWAGQTRNYALRKVVCAGYPALEYLLGGHAPKGRDGRRRIVFISQGTIGADLSRRAVELRGLLPGDRYAVVYKLHPNESKTWRELYPWLVGSGVEVVSSAERSIYDLFREASATVGVYSTAVIESLMWNVRGYVFGDLPGGDTMAPFLREGVLESVTSARELARHLEADPALADARVDGSCFWQPHAAANVVAALHEIVERGELP